MKLENKVNLFLDHSAEEVKYQLKSKASHKSMTRLLLMSYFPSGFWSRLISRILADDTIIDIIRSFFILPKEITQDMELVKLLDLKAEWILWQTGLQLKYGDITLFRMKEVLLNSATYYRQLRYVLGEFYWISLFNRSIFNGNLSRFVKI